MIMKTFIKTFIATTIIFYLLGAFVSVSFNIAEWAQVTRNLVALLSVCFGIMTGILVNESDYE